MSNQIKLSKLKGEIEEWITRNKLNCAVDINQPVTQGVFHHSCKVIVMFGNLKFISDKVTVDNEVQVDLDSILALRKYLNFEYPDVAFLFKFPQFEKGQTDGKK